MLTQVRVQKCDRQKALKNPLMMKEFRKPLQKILKGLFVQKIVRY
jgi:hypothetical protein